MRLRFSHHLATRDRTETLLVRIAASTVGVGHGQALPRAYLTGESVESALTDIRDRWWLALAETEIPGDADFPAAVAILDPIFRRADAERLNASYAAVDVAALDAFAAGRGIPAFLPVADPGPRMPLVGVITAGSAARAAWLARAMRWMRYRHFKVKVGTDEDGDARRLEAVRRVIGGDAWLAVDANAAWSPDEAERRMAGLKRFGVALVEEPLNRDAAREADFSRLEKVAGIPVMADESICTLADAEGLLRRGTPSWWNLRLAKNGGFAGVSALADLARRNGVHIYGGILVGETSLLAAAERAVMPAAGARCAEYGFPRIFLKGDPFRGGPGGFSGCFLPVSAGMKGLGISLRRSRLAGRAEMLWSEGQVPDR